MFDVSFEINGRKVRPNQIGNEIERAMLNDIKTQVTNSLRNVRDPETGERPKVTIRGRSIDRLEVTVTGYDRVVELARQKLK